MSGSVSIEYLNSLGLGAGVSGFTIDGGIYTTYLNNTGAATIKGTIVVTSSTADSVSIAPANADNAVGVVYESGMANGQAVKIIISGKAQVLLKNSQTATAGFWCGCSDNAGRMYQSAGTPSTSEHSREIGHGLETVTAGTNKLAWVNIHFN